MNIYLSIDPSTCGVIVMHVKEKDLWCSLKVTGVFFLTLNIIYFNFYPCILSRRVCATYL